MLPFATMRERRKLCAFELLEGLVKTVADVRMCDAGDAGDWVASQEEQAMPIWRMFQQLITDLGGTRILVDKSPSYSDHPSYLNHAHAIFGSAARYIHLVRHPYACIESGVELATKSIVNDAFNPTRGGDPSLAWRFVEAAWAATQKNVNEFLVRACETREGETHFGDAESLAHNSKPHALRIFYEDLLREPARVLSGVWLTPSLPVSLCLPLSVPLSVSVSLRSHMACMHDALPDPNCHDHPCLGRCV